MPDEKKQVGTRSIETEIEIAAPVDEVWRALTEAEELARWFPLEARVKPGAGGSVWASFGDGIEGEAPITIWEPNRRLQIVFGEPPKPEPGASKEPAVSTGGQAQPVRIATDYILEGRGGRTTLRLVYSGFSTDSAFDDLFDSTRRGWKFQLKGLRHYLERHVGTPRVVAQARAGIGALEPPEAWRRLTGPDGFQGPRVGTREGDRYSITAAGDRFEGVVWSYEPPKEFCGTVEELGEAVLRLWVDPGFPTGAPGMAYVWLSTYGLPKAKVDSFSARWTERLAGLFET